VKRLSELKICSKVLKENLRALCVKNKNSNVLVNKKDRFFLRQNDKVSVSSSLSETPLRTKNMQYTIKKNLRGLCVKNKTNHFKNKTSNIPINQKSSFIFATNYSHAKLFRIRFQNHTASAVERNINGRTY